MTRAQVYLSVVFILFVQYLVIFASHENNKEIYIVHLESPDEAQIEDLHNWHRSFFPNESPSSRIVDSYRNVLNGFASRLTPEEVITWQDKEGIISVRPQQFFHAQTTHSIYFLGLEQSLGLWGKSDCGKGMIIGVLDNGITPNHPSFHDEVVPPPPARWKGKCKFNFPACNNKLIGARYFHELGNRMPLDENSHGMLTSSTDTGNFMNGAKVLGMANGTTSGMAPLAHVAMYKVGSKIGCSNSDILTTIDAAIENGVDVISISLGNNYKKIWSYIIALGGFAAMQKGILVSCAAGNEGPLPSSVENRAPRLLTIGATTTDRKLRATIRLGDGKEIDGESKFQPKDFSERLLRLMFPAKNVSNVFCNAESLKNINVKGKIVLCESVGDTSRIDKERFVKDAGGAGMIFMNADESQGFTISADPHVLPATHVSYADALKIKSYIDSTSKPLATFLFKGTIFEDNHAPVVASFSSKGPNSASPGILKPDVIGPGINILVGINNTNTKPTFTLPSGTSMSCPHVPGIATLVKSAHPDWSPVAIKSTIMITADPIEDDSFATGAGHVNPLRASDPGLIYDIQPEDYVLIYVV